MIKVKLEDIAEALRKVGVAPEQSNKTLDILTKVAEEEKIEKEALKTPSQKFEFGIILYDANQELTGKEFTGSVYQIPVGADHSLVLSKISDASKTQNELARKKSHIITSIGEACEFLKRKFIKEKQVNIKTKNTVRVLISNNKII